MKKNVLIKGILLLIIIALLTIAFTGCYATAGTVYLIVSGTFFYDLEMDSIVRFWGVAPGTYILYNVPIGVHFFEATDAWGWIWGYDSVTQYITAGINLVYLFP